MRQCDCDVAHRVSRRERVIPDLEVRVIAQLKDVRHVLLALVGLEAVDALDDCLC